ncbi:hypothetical protein ABZ942_32060 [Nocardia sp. NPDC046473]|uniref:hypothetical protein n=1 Tax=Nocardia sp. NPDC046473 TaxID=3155733 RepID=UPI0033C2F4D8
MREAACEDATQAAERAEASMKKAADASKKDPSAANKKKASAAKQKYTDAVRAKNNACEEIGDPADNDWDSQPPA